MANYENNVSMTANDKVAEIFNDCILLIESYYYKHTGLKSTLRKFGKLEDELKEIVVESDLWEEWRIVDKFNPYTGRYQCKYRTEFEQNEEAFIYCMEIEDYAYEIEAIFNATRVTSKGTLKEQDVEALCKFGALVEAIVKWFGLFGANVLSIYKDDYENCRGL